MDREQIITVIFGASIGTLKEIVMKTLFQGKQSVLPKNTELPKQIEEKPERYQKILGRRHKFLRERILGIEKRQMSDFYGFERTSQLEDCEDGVDEFPTESMDRLSQVFFINPDYLKNESDTNHHQMFTTFVINASKKPLLEFLQKGFVPYFVCSPTFDDEKSHDYRMAYLMFCKNDDGYWRMIRSNYECDFSSDVDSGMNIWNLIYAMQDLSVNLKADDVIFIKSSQEQWEKFNSRDCCWYDKSLEHPSYNNADNEKDLFNKKWLAVKQLQRDKDKP